MAENVRPMYTHPYDTQILENFTGQETTMLSKRALIRLSYIW